MKGKKILIIGGVCIVIALLVGVAIKNKPKADESIGGDLSGVRVEVERVKTDNIETKISSSGKLEAIDTKKIYLEENNQIVTVNKEVGDFVKKGEVILTLDKEAKLSNEKELENLQTKLDAAQRELNDLSQQGTKGEILSAQSNIKSLQDTKNQTQSKIKEAKENISVLQNDLKLAKDDLKLKQDLVNEGLGSQKDVDDQKNVIRKLEQQIDNEKDAISLSESTLPTVDLQIQNAQYSLDVLLNKEEDRTKTQSINSKKTEIKDLETQIYNSKTSLNKKTTEVIAPISGIITSLPVEDGMTVSAGTEIATIVDPSKLKVKCDISPYYAADLKVGLDAILKYTGSKTIEIPGKISKVSAVATTEKTTNGESTYIPVEIEVAEPGDIVKPGFSVDAKIITNSRDNVCVVPLLAVFEEEENEYFVYVVKEDGSLEKRSVTQGLNSGLYIEVEGVKEGELIVSNPSDTLNESTKVSYEKVTDDAANEEEISAGDK